MSRRRSNAISQRLNHISLKSLILLSLIALLTVVAVYLQAPQPDEGSAAHIFQISVVPFTGILLVFLATADWKQPLRSVQALLVPGSDLVAAFAALFYLEHYYYLSR